MDEKQEPRLPPSVAADRFEEKRTIRFTTTVNGVEVDFEVTVPWPGAREAEDRTGEL